MTVAARLRARADAYSSDAAALRSLGDNDAALIYEAVRDELRKCADELPDDGDRTPIARITSAEAARHSSQSGDPHERTRLLSDNAWKWIDRRA